MRETAVHSFDTHKLIKKFQKSGFDEKQSELIVETILQSRDFDLSELATKVQLENTKSILDGTRSILEQKIESSKQELRVEIQASINTIIRWNVATFIAVAGIIIAALRFLLQH